ncbi:MAG: hypothetical protein HQL08_12330 [Nitrospirae bacterium]|nr:hypothetical protein [Nitrospirota bacterium]
MKSTKMYITVFGTTLLVLSAFAGQGMAGIDIAVGINVPPPPAYVMTAPPPVVLIPGTYVYVVPDINVQILFYHGLWWRPIEGRWYSSRSYNGPWRFVRIEKTPRVLIELPRDYYRIPRENRRIPHAELRANWDRWEKERHWDSQRREEHRDNYHERDRHEERRGDEGDRHFER